MKPLRLYKSRKTPMSDLRARLSTLGVDLSDKEFAPLSYYDLVQLVDLAEQKVAIEKKMVDIVCKDKVEKN